MIETLGKTQSSIHIHYKTLWYTKYAKEYIHKQNGPVTKWLIHIKNVKKSIFIYMDQDYTQWHILYITSTKKE